MKVLNIHRRIYPLSKHQIFDLLSTLSTPNDEIWPTENWPKMKLDNGLAIGSKGGHGPIKYFVESIFFGNQILFRFTSPKGFLGIHKFDVKSVDENKTELVHTIDMDAKNSGYFIWISSVKWLHNALIEDGLDKIHYKITGEKKLTKWSLWVKILRTILK